MNRTWVSLATCLLAGCMAEEDVHPEDGPTDYHEEPPCWLAFNNNPYAPASVTPVDWRAIESNAVLVAAYIEDELAANRTAGTLVDTCEVLQDELDWFETAVENDTDAKPTYFRPGDAWYFASTDLDGAALQLSFYAVTPNHPFNGTTATRTATDSPG